MADDSRVLVALQGGPDCVAAEIKYHRACYSSYTHPSMLLRERDKDATGAELSVYDQAFRWLMGRVEPESQLSKALAMNSLTEDYISKLQDLGRKSSYNFHADEEDCQSLWRQGIVLYSL